MKQMRIKNYLDTYSESATLAFFRLAFGLLMLLSLVRFAAYGWIEKFYIDPQFHFTYYGFGWVRPFGNYTYLLFAVCALAALCIAIGYKYRIAAVLFFLSFTYIECIDKTTYLNHYYFISVVGFVMVFLPANAYFSVDAYRNPRLAFQKIPRWNTDILKLLLAIVYIYAGIAKLNSDWLIEAMPLKIWLPNNSDLPILGPLLGQEWVIYAFAWIGTVYDLGIVFLLLNRKTRLFAFMLVVIFHLLTKILFPIGVFPYVMIVATLIFFDSSQHKKWLSAVAKPFRIPMSVFENAKQQYAASNPGSKIKMAFLAAFISFQLLFPFRYLCYPDELFWTEEGFRFSWRVMLMEKAGLAEFNVTDSKTGKKVHVHNADFLTAFQEKQMAFQPDFILEYAHFLHGHYQQLGFDNPQVRVESYVALNGRRSKLYIDPTIDLAQQRESFVHKTWILDFNDEIKGF